MFVISPRTVIMRMEGKEKDENGQKDGRKRRGESRLW